MSFTALWWQNVVCTVPCYGTYGGSLCRGMHINFHKRFTYSDNKGFPGGISGKESACNAGDERDAWSIPGLGRFPGGQNGNLLQYTCLENPVDRGAWWATMLGLYKITESGMLRAYFTRLHGVSGVESDCLASGNSTFLSMPLAPCGLRFMDILWSPVSRASLVSQMVKNLPAVQETEFNPWVRKTPMLGEPHGLRSLEGYSLWGCKESDTTEWLRLPLSPRSQDKNLLNWPSPIATAAMSLRS